MARRRKIDVRPIIGAAVVFLILGSIIFLAVYFMMLKPAAEALEESKASALSQVLALGDFGTTQAESDKETFTSQIERAGSEAEVNAILAEVNAAIAREEKRQELLGLVPTVAEGDFYSYKNTVEKPDIDNLLGNLKSTLESDINAKRTLAELEDYEKQIDNKATSAWRELHDKAILTIIDDRLSFTIANEVPYGEFMSKDEARAKYVENEELDWRTLKKMKFKEATVHVPVLDTFKRTPSITEGSTVKVYLYDIPGARLHPLFGNATVENVIYLEADFGTIGTQVWEDIKSRAAGLTPVLPEFPTDFGKETIEYALRANLISSYEISVIYVIKVGDTQGEEIVQAEFHQTATKDIILVLSV